MNNAFTIDAPSSWQTQELRALWKEAFGDTDAFLDTFASTAFSPDRCRCVTQDDKVVAALYWFDCEFMDNPVAYIYAVATAKAVRGQGICHTLMENTHEHLKDMGYAGALLSPADKELFHFYERIGYKTCTYMDELFFDENQLYVLEEKAISVRNISTEEFTKLRRSFLPKGAVIQENENLAFLKTQASFYTGDDFLMVAQKKASSLNVLEFLGDTTMIPNILRVLECTEGTFRTPGKEKPVGMYYPFTENSNSPSYLGFIFD